MTRLFLDNKGLVGSLPPELGNLSRLEYLNPSNNAGLRGPLPVEMSRLSGLSEFYANGTGLCVPPALSAWHAAIGAKNGPPACGKLPSFGGLTVADQGYRVGTPVADLTLPEATGDDAPLSYSISPALPEGLTFEPSTRVLSGTPTVAQGTTIYTYTARDSDGDEATLTFKITVESETDRYALVALYNATGGTRWTNQANWLSGRPIGEWHGVTTDGNGRVTRLSLSRNQLTGSIPPELGSLSGLRHLSLGANNGLTGPLPPEMGRLTNLNTLDTSATKLCLPPALSHWRAGVNSESGIPVCGVPTFGTATVAHQNYVRGMPIADLRLPAAVGGDGTLSYTLTPALPAGLSFDASARVLSGTPTAVRPTTVYTYMVRDADGETAQLAFTIAVTVDGVTSDPERDALVALYHATGGANWTWNTNWLSEQPIGEWHGVSTDSNGRVTRLDLSYNQLSGPIPSELGHLSGLETLYLSDNQLTGSIPLELGNLVPCGRGSS